MVAILVIMLIGAFIFLIQLITTINFYPGSMVAVMAFMVAINRIPLLSGLESLDPSVCLFLSKNFCTRFNLLQN